MAKTFKVLSALLSYPTLALREAAEALLPVLEGEGLLAPARVTALTPLVQALRAGDITDVQARYVSLFDRSRALSLHLFEHVHGESRDRGQAMVDLGALYRDHGLELNAPELPDYLPLFLEFLSLIEVGEARRLLGEAAHVVAALRARLEKRDSAYGAVLAAVESLADAPAPAGAIAVLEDEAEDDPDDLAALDRAWEAEAVTFGPGAAPGGEGACPKAAEMLERMTRSETHG
ncbi:MAG: nitrate reductase molybdenum cofactor assembly chaperone [Pseudomonadota bacterium]